MNAFSERVRPRALPVQAEVAANRERLLLDLGLELYLGLDLGVGLDLGGGRLTRASGFARLAVVLYLAMRAGVAVRAPGFQLAMRMALV